MEIFRAYNKRLNHSAEVVSIDFESDTIRLIMPRSEPKFIYKESLDNIEFEMFTRVTLDGISVFEGDIVADDDGKHFTVKLNPGGFYPFVSPVNKRFRKVTNA